MHPALCIDEIISEVLQELTKRSDHRSMALTCRAFHSPSIVALWSTLENLAPLVKLLGVEPAVVGSWQLQVPAVKPDWNKWSAYGKYVREIESVMIEHITTTLLGTAPSSEGLLPGLRKATIQSSHSYLALLVRLVAGPNLRDLRYGNTTALLPKEHVVPFADHCSLLINRASLSLTALDAYQLQLSIRRAEYVTANGSVGGLRSFAGVVGAQKSLRYLKIYNILDSPFNLLYEAAGLPHLSSLVMEIWRPHGMAEGSAHIVSFTLPPGSFRSLVELSVEMHSSLVNQFDAILLPNCTPLRKLTLLYLWNVGAPLLPEGLMGLTRLEELHVNIRDNNGSVSPAPDWLTQGRQDLLILASLRELRLVSLWLPAYASPGPQLLQCLARAWPKLESLTLSKPSGRSFPMYSPRNLAVFARYCPNLTFLEIPVFSLPRTSLGDSTMDEEVPSVRVTAPGMRRVIFQCVRTQEPDVFARKSEILCFWPNVLVEVLVFPKSVPGLRH